jgi:hypothetical protein
MDFYRTLVLVALFSLFIQSGASGGQNLIPRPLGNSASDFNVDRVQAANTKQKKKQKSRKPSRRITHAEALDLCRKKYGRSAVARAQIKPSGKVICWTFY